MLILEEAGWVIRTDDRTREHLHQADWGINPALSVAFKDQQRDIIKARQRAEDERRRIAKIERRIVSGYDPAWDEELMTGT
jgi:putative SOS response-associated peptidase YedK